MAFYEGKIFELDQLLTMVMEGHGPNELSFLGIIDSQTHEKHDIHEFRVNHEIILHCGSSLRLVIQYSTGFDDENRYDPRILDDETCSFFPKGSLCFFPHLETTFADGEKIYCRFKGGDSTFGKYKKFRNQIFDEIELNRVCLLLDVQPSSIYAFLTSNEVSLEIFDDVIE